MGVVSTLLPEGSAILVVGVSPLCPGCVPWLDGEQRDSFKRGSSQAGSVSQPQTLPSYVLLCSGPGPVLAQS